MKSYIFSILFLISSLLQQSDFESSVDSIFEKKEMKRLEELIVSEVNLDIAGKKGFYSQTQAIQILKDFILKQGESSVSKLSEGQREQVFYFIGNYKTEKGSYKLFINFLKKGNVFQISEIRIE